VFTNRAGRADCSGGWLHQGLQRLLPESACREQIASLICRWRSSCLPRENLPLPNRLPWLPRWLLRQKRAAPSKKAAPPAKKAAAVKATPQATITLKQIAAELAEAHDLPKKVAEAVLGDLVTMATEHLKKGDKIRLTGLGILQARGRPARMGRNPATGASIKIAASKKIAFRPAKELKEAV
jgi:DNA-binding protein HU-beta